jgi:hypothetical protein
MSVEHAMKITGPFNFKAMPHVGPIHSAVPGRTDHLPMKVPPNAYVLPADVVAALGEHNTMAGFEVAKRLFGPALSKPIPGGLPYGAPSPSARGGKADDVGIIAAGGEHVLSPEQVQAVGKGSMADGHKILDEFVRQVRAGSIKKLKSLPGPKRD